MIRWRICGVLVLWKISQRGPRKPKNEQVFENRTEKLEKNGGFFLSIMSLFSITYIARQTEFLLEGNNCQWSHSIFPKGLESCSPFWFFHWAQFLTAIRNMIVTLSKSLNSNKNFESVAVFFFFFFFYIGSKILKRWPRFAPFLCFLLPLLWYFSCANSNKNCARREGKKHTRRIAQKSWTPSVVADSIRIASCPKLIRITLPWQCCPGSQPGFHKLRRKNSFSTTKEDKTGWSINSSMDGKWKKNGWPR